MVFPWLTGHRSALPGQSILTIDTAAHNHYFAASYPILGPRRFLNPGGSTPMGLGPTAIIGAKLARPDLPCVCVKGDSGFLMVNQEVATACEWETPVVWIVFNNGALEAIRSGQKSAYDGRIIGTEFSQPIDSAMMGRSMGALALRVSHHDEFVPAVQEALASGRPTVIDVLVAADAVPPPVAGRWAEPERDWPSPLPRGTLRHYTPDTWPG